MTRMQVHRALSLVVAAQVFFLIDIRLGTLNILPDWAGYLLLWPAIKVLGQYARELELCRSLCLLLGIWDGLGWLLVILSRRELLEGGEFQLVELVVTVAGIYFHFSLFTALAILAERYSIRPSLDRKLRIYRNLALIIRVLGALKPYFPRLQQGLSALLAWSWVWPAYILILALYGLAGIYYPLRLCRAFRPGTPALGPDG